MIGKTRADELLVARGLCCDIKQATAALLANSVRSGNDNSIVINKPGTMIDSDALLTVKRSGPFVSRGGLKLEGALEVFTCSPRGLRVVDLGASTGGFTDCLLAHGAASVAAVDVGYGQLDNKLAQDGRVTVFDRTNIRTVDPVVLGAPFDLAVADLSFVGITKVASCVVAFLMRQGEAILLIKPQFEASRDLVANGGVVTDPLLHKQVLESVIYSLGIADLPVIDITFSPITGRAGNIEFWVRCKRGGTQTVGLSDKVEQAIQNSRSLVKESRANCRCL